MESLLIIPEIIVGLGILSWIVMQIVDWLDNK